MIDSLPHTDYLIFTQMSESTYYFFAHLHEFTKVHAAKEKMQV